MLVFNISERNATQFTYPIRLARDGSISVWEPLQKAHFYARRVMQGQHQSPEVSLDIPSYLFLFISKNFNTAFHVLTAALKFYHAHTQPMSLTIKEYLLAHIKKKKKKR